MSHSYVRCDSFICATGVVNDCTGVAAAATPVYMRMSCMSESCHTWLKVSHVTNCIWDTLRYVTQSLICECHIWVSHVTYGYEWVTSRIAHGVSYASQIWVSSCQSHMSDSVTYEQLGKSRQIHSVLKCAAVWCSVLQCAAVCCSVLQCAKVCCSVPQCVTVCYSVRQCVGVYCSVL